MKKLLFLLILIPFCVSAQIDESDTLKFKGAIALTGFWQGGNVETLIFRAKSDLSFRPLKNVVFKTSNSYVYQEFGKQKADEDILSLNFLYLNPGSRVYPLVLGFVSTNFRREIQLRSIFGGGLTYQIINGKKNWLKVSISSEYEQTDFGSDRFNIADYNGVDYINTFRGTVWLNGKYELLDKKIVLTHESYYQPSLQKLDNYRWQLDLGLAFPIWEFLSLKVNYRHTFESIVIESQRKEDRFLTFGFSIKSK